MVHDPDREQPSERAVRDERLERSRLPPEPVVLRDHHVASGSLARAHQRPRVLEVERERLLADDVAPGRERELGERAVSGRRRDEQHGVRLDRGERLFERAGRRHAEVRDGPLAHHPRAVDQRCEPEAGRAIDDLGPALPPQSGTDLDQ